MDDAFLADDIEIFKSRNPVLQESDIALFASILRVHADYFQAVLGQQPLIMAEQGLALRRSMKLEALRQEELLKAKKAEAGLVPVPNLCEHVSALRTIRRIKDEKERYYYLTKFFAKYQGKRREDNWIECKVCQKELLCVHERLLIQAYLNPLDKPALLKRVNLNFSGGVFQGYYICRSCGQPIQQIGYDTNIQFDDEGRPMSGRAELVDKEALTNNKNYTLRVKDIYSSLSEIEENCIADPDKVYLFTPRYFELSEIAWGGKYIDYTTIASPEGAFFPFVRTRFKSHQPIDEGCIWIGTASEFPLIYVANNVARWTCPYSKCGFVRKEPFLPMAEARKILPRLMNKVMYPDLDVTIF
jgi:hypothetical protein